MDIIKLTLAAATLTIGIAASASVLPVDKLGAAEVDGIQADQVRLVCSRWGAAAGNWLPRVSRLR
jgi:hypothetical protein